MSNELDVINFTNIDSEDYVGMWGGKGETIKAGETRPFPRFLAEHFAKHLVTKIMLKSGGDWANDSADRKPMEAKILGGISVTPTDVEIETPEVKEPEFEDIKEVDDVKLLPTPTVPIEQAPVKKKMGRPKKVKS